MSLPPLVLDLTVARTGRHRVRVWLPLFLLWPLALVVGALTLVVALVVDAALLAAGRRRRRYTALLARCFATVGETRGLVIRFNNAETAFDMTIH